ncbi:TPA: ShET2/EspL2 family type III secretion system effector toxin [Escherichia coli]|nr:ShET2/EspL2 family type III secretion system effector toxin [Escherichia coli]
MMLVSPLLGYDSRTLLSAVYTDKKFPSNIERVTNTQDIPRFTKPTHLPYYSEKRNVDLNLNGILQDSSGEYIVCRHLSTYWIQQFNELGGRIDYSKFNSPDGILASMSMVRNESMHTGSGVIEFIEKDSWGFAILAIFRDMKINGDKIRALDVYTTEHHMALGLKIKSKSDGDCFVIQFYDPNHTGTHLRAAFSISEQEKIEKLTINDFIDKTEKINYGLKQQETVVFVDRHNPVIPPLVKTLPKNLLQSHVIYHAMYLGAADILKQLAKDIQPDVLSTREMETLLSARNMNGCPGLFMALQNGHVEVVRAYGAMLFKAQLAPDKNAELLAAKGRDDSSKDVLPGLFMALQNGHEDAVQAYGELLISAGLSQENNAVLLGARSNHGILGLLMSLYNGHTESIRVYGKILLNIGLSSDTIAELLAAKDASGVNGLFVALQEGHTEAVRAYGEILRNAELNSKKNAELLAAKDENGQPGLYMASYNGHSESILAYLDIVKLLGLNSESIADEYNETGRALFIKSLKRV